MISFIGSLLLIISFFLSDYLIEALKRTIKLFTKYILKLLSFFGIKLRIKEKSLKVSDEFKKTFKEIRAVKLSNKNLKEIALIDYISLALFIISATLIIVNLQQISDNIIAQIVFKVINKIGFVKSIEETNVLVTALLFSILSFSGTRLFQYWKQTKPARQERRVRKLKEKALQHMTTKELLEEAKNKDLNNRKELE